MKYILILCVIYLVAFAYGKPGCPGCIQEVDHEKAAEVLKDSLSKLAEGDGPYYELVKINTATTQVVSGSKHVINADLENREKKIEKCNIEIWSQPWLPDGIRVSFDCEGKDNVVKTYSA